VQRNIASKNYPYEFKIEAVRLVADRGYKSKDVAKRTITLSLKDEGKLAVKTVFTK